MYVVKTLILLADDTSMWARVWVAHGVTPLLIYLLLYHGRHSWSIALVPRTQEKRVEGIGANE
jgi:hypothetical protein